MKLKLTKKGSIRLTILADNQDEIILKVDSIMSVFDVK
jgi:hypothetical protein